jgi:hypothetical protein
MARLLLAMSHDFESSPTVEGARAAPSPRRPA